MTYNISHLLNWALLGLYPYFSPYPLHYPHATYRSLYLHPFQFYSHFQSKPYFCITGNGWVPCYYKSDWGHMFSSCKRMGVFLSSGIVVVVIIECCTLVPPLGFPRIYEGCPLMWYSFEKHMVWSGQVAIINFQHKIRLYENKSTRYFWWVFGQTWVNLSFSWYRELVVSNKPCILSL